MSVFCDRTIIVSFVLLEAVHLLSTAKRIVLLPQINKILPVNLFVQLQKHSGRSVDADGGQPPAGFGDSEAGVPKTIFSVAIFRFLWYHQRDAAKKQPDKLVRWGVPAFLALCRGNPGPQVR